MLPNTVSGLPGAFELVHSARGDLLPDNQVPSFSYCQVALGYHVLSEAFSVPFKL